MAADVPALLRYPAYQGTAVSRPMDSILNEAEILQNNGIREINLIAQDVTDMEVIWE